MLPFNNLEPAVGIVADDHLLVGQVRREGVGIEKEKHLVSAASKPGIACETLSGTSRRGR